MLTAAVCFGTPTSAPQPKGVVAQLLDISAQKLQLPLSDQVHVMGTHNALFHWQIRHITCAAK